MGEKLSIDEKIKPILPILFILLIGIDLFFPGIEPFYTIINDDQYPHNVTIKVSEDAGGFLDERFYQLDPGESATLEKPI